MRSKTKTDSAYSDEGLIELCEILAAGLMRLRARQSSALSADRGESFLDFGRHQSSADDPTIWISTRERNRVGTSTEEGELQGDLGHGEGD
jgi:hypothetical protein